MITFSDLSTSIAMEAAVLGIELTEGERRHVEQALTKEDQTTHGIQKAILDFSEQRNHAA